MTEHRNKRAEWTNSQYHMCGTSCLRWANRGMGARVLLLHTYVIDTQLLLFSGVFLFLFVERSGEEEKSGRLRMGSNFYSMLLYNFNAPQRIMQV